jgi:hypothetical protein
MKAEIIQITTPKADGIAINHPMNFTTPPNLLTLVAIIDFSVLQLWQFSLMLAVSLMAVASITVRFPFFVCCCLCHRKRLAAAEQC